MSWTNSGCLFSQMWFTDSSLHEGLSFPLTMANTTEEVNSLINLSLFLVTVEASSED